MGGGYSRSYKDEYHVKYERMEKEEKRHDYIEGLVAKAIEERVAQGVQDSERTKVELDTRVRVCLLQYLCGAKHTSNTFYYSDCFNGNVEAMAAADEYINRMIVFLDQ